MKLFFAGGALEVGASCILLKIDGKNILLDSGIRLNTQDNLPDFRMIQENGGVDAVIISHGHTDHIGSLPIISREYPDAPIYMTHATKDITKVLLYDSLKIMQYRDEEIPVYSEDHVVAMINKIICYSYQYTFRPFRDKEIDVTFYQAGHILGASAIYIQSEEGSVFYSGDFSTTPQRSVNGIMVPKLRPDVVLIEGTYGDKLHANRKAEEDRLIERIGQAIEKGGKVLVPSFAVGRAQEIILIVKNAIKKGTLPKIPVYVDGMVKDVCRIYKLNPNYLKKDLSKKVWKGTDIFFDENIQAVDHKAMREEIIRKEGPCCIVSSSGMLTGGPSLFYAEQMVGDEKNLIAITGYQDEDAPGRVLLELLEDENKEKLFPIGERILPVKCAVGKYGLSAHGDKGEILGIIQKLSPRAVFFLHGNKEILHRIGKEVQEQHHGRIYLPEVGKSYNIQLQHPRKQIQWDKIESLQKGQWPTPEDIEALWHYLKDQPHNRGYTLEEMMYIWSGRLDMDQSMLKILQEALYKSEYFEQDKYRLFLYHPLESVDIDLEKQQYMEVNQMLRYVEEIFPEEAGVYKKGARHDEKIALISFNFPQVAKDKYAKTLEKFEGETGWKVEINANCNLLALDAYFEQLIGEQKHRVVKGSYYQVENLYRIKCTEAIDHRDTLMKEFCNTTGVRLVLEYPEKGHGYQREEITIPQNLEDQMEQNQAIAYIDRIFMGYEDKLYKKSIKQANGVKYFELSFITPEIGQKYAAVIKDVETETGWPMKINQTPNQMEMIKEVQKLLNNHGMNPKKNPSILQIDRLIKVKLNENPIEEIWGEIKTKCQHITGYDLVCS